MKLHRLLPVLLSVTLASSAAANDTRFTFVDLGTLPGGSASVAYGLNDSEQVVGWATIPGCLTQNGLPCRRAYVWQNGVMTMLDKLPGDEDSFARSINNNGLIAGTSEDNILFGSGTFHGAYWDNTGIHALPDLGNGTSFAHDVNDSGVIAGHSVSSTTMRDSAVIWTGGVISDVGTGEGHSYSRLEGINESGSSVGFAWNLFSPNDSIAYDGVKWATIGGIDGQFQNSQANDVNDNGLAVGLQAFPSGSWHAAGWQLGKSGSIDFGVLPGLDTGEMYGVNNAGESVGASYDGSLPGSNRAHFWDGTHLRDLNDFMPASSDYHIFEARDINENGDIIGTAVIGGEFRAFLLHREPIWEQYDVGVSPANSADLNGIGSSSIGETLDVVTTNLTGTISVYFFCLDKASYPLLGGVGLVDPNSLIITRYRLVNAGQSKFKINFPDDPSLVGAVIYVQTATVISVGPDVWELSNGLEIPICE